MSAPQTPQVATERDRQQGTALPKPPWVRVRLPSGKKALHLARLLRHSCLHTVCEEALCPNMGTCWRHGHATFMILGNTCTRRCKFCNVTGGSPRPPDPDEPARVASVVRELALKHVVVTSVTRDDLPDGGAVIWAETIRQVRAAAPTASIEALVPDFGGSESALKVVLASAPDILAHNLETVANLYPRARIGADYQRSLNLLKMAHSMGLMTKTGIMLGLGEKKEEVIALMHDAVQAGCEILTIGQYLQPSRAHLPVQRYLEPAEFEEYRNRALELGFAVVVAGPLVRSSFYSREQELYLKKRKLDYGQRSSLGD